MAEVLVQGFFNSGIEVIGVFGRNKERLASLSAHFNVNRFNSIEEIPEDSLIILAVSDDAIEEVSSLIPTGYTVVHTSGSAPIGQIQSERRGVLYPLQTMTSGRKVDLFKVPFFIEASSDEILLQLRVVAFKLTDKIYVRSSEQRKKIHLAAVVLNNFVSQLVKMSEDYLVSIEENRKILQPLLEETVSKIGDLGAEKALTGPAKRGDKGTIEAHEELLKGDLKEVYQMLSNIILKENGKL